MKTTLKHVHVVSALVLGVAFIIGVSLVATALYRIRSLDNTISVSGSARETVVSDIAKLVLKVESTAFDTELQQKTRNITKETERIVEQLSSEGIDAEKIVISPVTTYEEYQQNTASKKYTVFQLITMQSTDVYMMDLLAKKIPEFTTNGVYLSVSALEFYYKGLAQLRVSLIQKAIEDAQNRAEGLVQATGVKLGKLKQASTGVVQVLPPNGTDVSDYGTYDTSTIEKEIVVTVKSSFQVR